MGKRNKGRVNDYAGYIRSKRWQRIRRQALEYHGHVCSVCGSSESLCVHHKNYARVGAELMTDLELLCRPCLDNKYEGSRPATHDPITQEYLSLEL